MERQNRFDYYKPLIISMVVVGVGLILASLILLPRTISNDKSDEVEKEAGHIHTTRRPEHPTVESADKDKEEQINDKTFIDTTTTDESTNGELTISKSEPQSSAPFVDTEAVNTALDAEKPDSKIEEVSPHGFGPYPEIPEDFPQKVAWKESIEMPPNFPLPSGVNRTDLPKYVAQQLELFNRVMIKAWNEGDRAFTGGSISYVTGKVYLTYPRTVYVQWRNRVFPDGTVVKEVQSALGDNDVPLARYAKDFPDDVRVIDYDSAGIDPYEYLDLR